MSSDTISIEIRGADAGLLSGLFGKTEPSRGDAISIGGDITLTYQGRKRATAATRQGPVEDIIVFLVSIPVGIGVNLFSQWLYEKLKSRKAITIEVEGTTVSPDEGEIEKVIGEKLSSQSS